MRQKNNIVTGWVGYEPDLGIFWSTFDLGRDGCIKKIGKESKQGVVSVRAEIRLCNIKVPNVKV